MIVEANATAVGLPAAFAAPDVRCLIPATGAATRRPKPDRFAVPTGRLCDRGGATHHHSSVQLSVW